MKTVLLAALLLVCCASGSWVVAQESKNVSPDTLGEQIKAPSSDVKEEIIQLPLGVLQKTPEGWGYWDGAVRAEIEDYQSSAVWGYFKAATTWVCMTCIIYAMGGHDTLGAKAISLYLTAGLAIDVSFNLNRAYRVYTQWGEDHDGIWQVPFRDRKEPALLILFYQHPAGNVHYTIMSLYDQEASDDRYINDEYLRLAKILYKRQIYLTLTPEEEKPGDQTSLRDELARDSDLAVSLFQSTNQELLYHVDFSGSASLPWVELSLTKAQGADAEQEYLSAVSPLWIGHVADWLSKPASWNLMRKFAEARQELPEQSGPMFADDELGIERILAKEADSGCLQLDMDSVTLRLPPSGILMTGDQHCFSLGRKTTPYAAEHRMPASFSYNQYDTESALVWEWGAKKVKLYALNWLTALTASKGLKWYFGRKNQQAVVVVGSAEVIEVQTTGKDLVPVDNEALMVPPDNRGKGGTATALKLANQPAREPLSTMAQALKTHRLAKQESLSDSSDEGEGGLPPPPPPPKIQAPKDYKIVIKKRSEMGDLKNRPKPPGGNTTGDVGVSMDEMLKKREQMLGKGKGTGAKPQPGLAGEGVGGSKPKAPPPVAPRPKLTQMQRDTMRTKVLELLPEKELIVIDEETETVTVGSFKVAPDKWNSFAKAAKVAHQKEMERLSVVAATMPDRAVEEWDGVTYTFDWLLDFLWDESIAEEAIIE
ncbi:MAG: hypothetical protein ACR2PX_00440 [Endozoicomonas sp.]|uniref:hypothetical protein n=1 Tax=Endozoicomonas sp. TaxID=1892382 RepID=UPI003D9B39E0